MSFNGARVCNCNYECSNLCNNKVALPPAAQKACLDATLQLSTPAATSQIRPGQLKPGRMHGPMEYRILNGLRQGVAAACDRWPVAGDTPHSWAATTDGVVIGILIGLTQLVANM